MDLVLWLDWVLSMDSVLCMDWVSRMDSVLCMDWVLCMKCCFLSVQGENLRLGDDVLSGIADMLAVSCGSAWLRGLLRFCSSCCDFWDSGEDFTGASISV
ncbi:hypothetical protein KC19_3G144000 [Ceratodon purpureus]|uniref:Secreted protein n=1 Tax=Ceratodon purpureus TaxID=3225 RepID=A0A8T0IKZ1_CERPU|nr:hypothetical protein KC19_3G144000 [Ceratodon purpureus]